MRHEYKHSITALEDLQLSMRLRKCLKHDLHADSHGIYRVSSLYFDNLYDKALREKIDGINQREKFRIRYYNDNLNFIRLEKKFKIKGLSKKFSAPISHDEVQRMLSGDVAFLLYKEQPLLQEFYAKMQSQLLRPQTIVSYEREAFIYEPGNVRVTLDRNLQSGLRSQDFLDPQRLLTPVHDGLSVLEVKYDRFLPELVQLLVQTPNRRAAAYSKYAVCRRYD